MKKEMKQYLSGMGLGLLWFFVSLYVTGCGMSRGWEFKIGVNPISEVKDTKGLRYEEAHNGESKKTT